MRSPTSSSTALWTTLLLGLTVPSWSQTPEAPRGSVDERIEVELVNVEVWVTDPRGRPISGLEVEDFRLFHDDQPVEITHFAEVRDGVRVSPAAREEESAPAGDPAAVYPSHLVIYVDQSRMHPSSYRAVFQGLREFVAGASVAPEQILLLRQDRNLFIEAPFGSSSQQLEAALARLAELAPSGVDVNTETELALDALSTAWSQAEGVAGAATQGITSGVSNVPLTSGQGSDASSPRSAVGGGGGTFGPSTCDLFLSRAEPIVDGWAREQRQRIAATLGHLSETATYLAALPGVTSLIYVSDGLETQPAAGLISYAGTLCPAGQASLAMSGLSEELSRSLLGVTRHLNSNRVTVHALQAKGLEGSRSGSASRGRPGGGGGGFQASSAFSSTRAAAEREGLVQLARETGGRTVFNQNDFGPALADIGRDASSYYSLAYEPPSEGRGTEHRIAVRLSEAGDFDLRYRRGYLEKDAEDRLAERLEGALSLGLVSNPLQARLGAGGLRSGEGGLHVLPLHVIVPLSEVAFLPTPQGDVATFKVRVVARRLGAPKEVVEERRFRMRRAAGVEQKTAGLPVELELAAGEYTVGVALRDEASRRESYVTTTIPIGQ